MICEQSGQLTIVVLELRLRVDHRLSSPSGERLRVINKLCAGA